MKQLKFKEFLSNKTSLAKQLLIWIPIVFWAWVIGIYTGQKIEKSFWVDEVGIEFEAAAGENFAVISTDIDRKIEVSDIDGKKIIRMTKSQ